MKAEMTEDISFYELCLFADASDELQRLERNKESYFSSLYEDISPAMTYINEEEGLLQMKGHRTEDTALNIIEKKLSYETKLRTFQERDQCWNKVMSALPEEDQRIVNVLIRKPGLTDQEIEYLLETLTAPFCAVLHERNQLKEKRVKSWFHNMIKTGLYESQPKKQKNNEGKEQYLIRGKFVYLTTEEYADYQEKLKAYILSTERGDAYG